MRKISKAEQQQVDDLFADDANVEITKNEMSKDVDVSFAAKQQETNKYKI